MTRDEIMMMKAGRELDALVAEKVMGFPVKIGDITGEPYHAQFGYSMPNYSTDIAAAWEVLEKFTDVDLEKAGDNYRVTINAFAQADAHHVSLAICRAAIAAAEGGR